MSIFVRYQVPVLAEVDLEGGRVIRVQVDDEAVGEPLDVFAVDEQGLSTADLDIAIVIAAGQPWPAWELGG